MRKEIIGDCTLYLGDCLEVMPTLDKVDMVLTDPPYGTTACKWDSIIPLDSMWERVRGVTNDNSAIVMTASQPFTSVLVMSNPGKFKYDWTWRKSKPTGVLNAKRQPLRIKEDIIVFYGKQAVYNPQGVVACNRMTNTGAGKANQRGNATGKITQTESGKYRQTTTGYPRNIIEISSAGKTVHPTQKPVALMEYLIRTYTNEGDTVLDFTMGSGTTGVACINTNRKFIGIEIEPTYFDIACKRIRESGDGIQH